MLLSGLLTPALDPCQQSARNHGRLTERMEAHGCILSALRSVPVIYASPWWLVPRYSRIRYLYLAWMVEPSCSMSSFGSHSQSFLFPLHLNLAPGIICLRIVHHRYPHCQSCLVHCPGVSRVGTCAWPTEIIEQTSSQIAFGTRHGPTTFRHFQYSHVKILIPTYLPCSKSQARPSKARCFLRHPLNLPSSC